MGESLSSLNLKWQRANRLDDEAASSLLQAWAATLAAQEHVQFAVAQGIVQRVAGSVDISKDAAFGEVGRCEGLEHVAETAHRAAVQSCDKALWALLEQVLALEHLADNQEKELQLKQ